MSLKKFTRISLKGFIPGQKVKNLAWLCKPRFVNKILEKNLKSDIMYKIFTVNIKSVFVKISNQFKIEALFVSVEAP